MNNTILRKHSKPLTQGKILHPPISNLEALKKVKAFKADLVKIEYQRKYRLEDEDYPPVTNDMLHKWIDLASTLEARLEYSI